MRLLLDLMSNIMLLLLVLFKFISILRLFQFWEVYNVDFWWVHTTHAIGELSNERSQFVDKTITA